MRILVIGDEDNLDECRRKFGDSHEYRYGQSLFDSQEVIGKCDVIFDFVNNRDQTKTHLKPVSVPLFLNTAKSSLNAFVESDSFNLIFGFAGLPTFLNREILEVSLTRPSDLERLTQIAAEMKTDFQVVEDKVGLVTPRIICMIINEAYYTFQEGTASREDIDLAMKLGTNYPYGPFEWCGKIGVKNVVELLQAVYRDTGNERYKICPLMEEECQSLTNH